MNQKVLEFFDGGFSCAQSIFAAYSSIFGVDEKTALKIASAFGGGIARMGNICGAVSGALMVIGLKFGPDKEQAYSVARKFVEEFKAANGSILCKELLGYDISTEEGLQKARQEKVFKSVCPRYLKDSSQILEELLGSQAERIV